MQPYSLFGASAQNARRIIVAYIGISYFLLRSLTSISVVRVESTCFHFIVEKAFHRTLLFTACPENKSLLRNPLINTLLSTNERHE